MSFQRPAGPRDLALEYNLVVQFDLHETNAARRIYTRLVVVLYIIILKT